MPSERTQRVRSLLLARSGRVVLALRGGRSRGRAVLALRGGRSRGRAVLYHRAVRPLAG